MTTAALIMAGGQGERFWPKSRAKLSKQFLALTNQNKTMLQLTVGKDSAVGRDGKRVRGHVRGLRGNCGGAAAGSAAKQYPVRACGPQHGALHCPGRDAYSEAIWRR